MILLGCYIFEGIGSMKKDGKKEAGKKEEDCVSYSQRVSRSKGRGASVRMSPKGVSSRNCISRAI